MTSDGFDEDLAGAVGEVGSAVPAEVVPHSALVGYMSQPVARWMPIRRSTVVLVIAFAGFGTLLSIYPPSTPVAPPVTTTPVNPFVPVPVTTTTSPVPTTTSPPHPTTTTSASTTTSIPHPTTTTHPSGSTTTSTSRPPVSTTVPTSTSTTGRTATTSPSSSVP